MAGIQLLQRVPNILCRYLVGRNRSTLLFLRSTCIWILHRNLRWPPKVVGKQFVEKSAVDSADTLDQIFRQNLSCSISKIMHFCIYAEIQDGCQKWRKNNFGKNLPEDSADTLRDKSFTKITLALSVCETDMFLHFKQKFNMPPKVAGKRFLQKLASRLYRYPGGQKFRRNCSSSLRF